jgi:hypothetical protein
LGEHVCANVAAQGEDGCEVYLEHGGPVVVGELVGWVPFLDPAAVEEDVDFVAVGEDGGDEGGYGGGGGEVRGVDCGGAAEGFDGGLGGLIAGVALGKGLECERDKGGGGRGTWTRRMLAPASARARAMDWPIPRVPPVTRAVWPSRENSSCTAVMVKVWCGIYSSVPKGLVSVVDIKRVEDQEERLSSTS